MHGTLRILTVCTANVCRSPVAAHLLARRVSEAGWHVEVRSAGTHGGINDVHPYTVSAAAEYRIELATHVSRPLTRGVIASDGSDLIVTMSREHLRRVAAIDPAAWPRTFTLKELVRRATDASASPNADFEAWRTALATGRKAADLLGADLMDDIGDPFGGPASGHVAMVVEIDDLCTRFARLMPPPPG